MVTPVPAALAAVPSVPATVTLTGILNRVPSTLVAVYVPFRGGVAVDSPEMVTCVPVGT